MGKAPGRDDLGPAARLPGVEEEAQQYGLRPAGQAGTIPRATMVEAETLVAKAMAATKETKDFWKSIVEGIV